jgi:uncharacterized delta-60 repeat protein
LVAQTCVSRLAAGNLIFGFETAEVNRVEVSMIQLWKLSGANAMLPLVHRSPFRRVFLVFVLVLSGAAVCAAAPTPTPTPGQLDTTFVPAPGTNDAVNVVIPQPDGKVIAAGRFTFANNVARNRIARFNFNGSLDATFNPGTGADGEITAAVLQPDGRIVVAGRFTSFNGFTHNRVCRLNADGSVDQSFGLGNGIDNAALALALQSDGRIIVGGQFSQVDLTQRFNLARLNTNGSVDLSFDPVNGPNGDVNAIVIQPDGRIVIGGTFIGYNGFARGGVARVLGTGALDPSFDSGVGTGGNVFALALQHNGQIVLGGRFAQYSGTNRTFIARVFGDGSLDFGFNPVPNNWVQSFAVEPDDRILVGGFFTDINGSGRNGIARLNTNGSVDLTFNPGAGFVGSLTNDATQVDSIALQQFGRILVGGIFTSYNNQLRDNIVRLFDNAASFHNLSARAHVFTGERILIAGFILQGSENKTLLIRGLGPSLGAFGVPTPLADPTLSLFDHTGALIAANDNWKATQQAQIQATGLAPPNNLDAAILISLSPGAYTAFLQGKATATGIGMAEVYDVDPSANAQPTNLSARAFVGTGDDVLIGGTVVDGAAGSLLRVLVRALGPSLAGAGVTTPLANPTLSLRDANGNVIASNDNWKDSQQAAIAATGKAPPNDNESAILGLLAPGNYTAIVAGKNGTTGVALIEFYSLP